MGSELSQIRKKVWFSSPQALPRESILISNFSYEIPLGTWTPRVSEPQGLVTKATNLVLLTHPGSPDSEFRGIWSAQIQNFFLLPRLPSSHSLRISENKV